MSLNSVNTNMGAMIALQSLNLLFNEYFGDGDGGFFGNLG